MSITYAWAHPTSGIREQASSIDEAVRRAWLELAECPQEIEQVYVFEQDRVGRVNSSVAVQETLKAVWPDGYAWASPNDAVRHSRPTWEEAIEAIQRELREMRDPPDVIVYRQRGVAVVDRRDGEPPEFITCEVAADSPSSLLAAIQAGSRSDCETISTMALLWIAESLQQLVSLERSRED